MDRSVGGHAWLAEIHGQIGGNDRSGALDLMKAEKIDTAEWDQAWAEMEAELVGDDDTREGE